MRRAWHVVLVLLIASSPLACGSSDSSAASAAADPRLAGRTYLVKVPAGYDGSHPVPLIVAMHGYGNDAAGIETYFGFDPVADEHGFLVVYPDGTTDSSGHRFFDATDACCDFDDTHVDDVGFIDALLDLMEAKYNVDTNRVYAVGHSNGGFMAYRLACDLSSRFAAVVSLEGAMWSDPSRCNPSAPVSILHVHGTDDQTILPDGGTSIVGVPNRDYPSVAQTIDDWKGFDDCADNGVTDPDPGHIDNETSHPTEVTEWEGPRAAVELWMIQGGTHSPELTSVWTESVYGFLAAHPRSNGGPALTQK